METLVKRASILMVAVLPWAATHARAQDSAVSGKEIQATWVGKDLTGTTANGAQVAMRLEADGKASVSAGSTTDTGTWRITDTGYCTTWKNIRAGQERCFTVTKIGEAFKVMNPDGSLSGQFTGIK